MKVLKRILVICALLVLALPLNAQNSTTRFFVACEYENVTIDSTAGGIGFTAAEYNATECGGTNGAASVTFTVACASGTDCPIRMTLDSTAPTTSVGMRAIYGQSVTIYSITNIKTFRAIREGATSAVLNVQYFR